MKNKLSCCILLAALCFFSLPAAAHMPSIERRDFTEKRPFKIKGTIEKGQAVYAYLKSGSDVDVYRFVVTQEEISEKGIVTLRVRVNVPACKGAEEFLPWLAIVGPGLSSPTEEMPFTLPEGYGAIVVKNTEPGAERNFFYEQYSKKSYYITDYYDYTITEPGTWYLYYWDPYNLGGDYLALWGVKDSFDPGDGLKMLLNLPAIVSDRVMHSECEWIIPDNATAASSSCLK
jgi:hypothetical protein